MLGMIQGLGFTLVYHIRQSGYSSADAFWVVLLLASSGLLLYFKGSKA